MAANPRYEKALTDLTKSLVKAAVNFPETSEKFEACMQYAFSNFKYNKFLSVDSVNVTRSYKSLAEKLSIHSNTEKAIALKNLLDQFLETDISKTSLSKSDTHYGMLSILFDLSTNVINSEYTSQVKPKNLEEVSNFDWKAYLLDDDDIPLAGEFKLDDLSDQSESEFDDEVISSITKLGTYTSSNNKVKEESSVLISLSDSKLRHSNSVINKMKQTMVFPYWDYKSCKKDFGDFTLPMRLALGIGTSNVPTSGLCLDEEHVVREIICLLLGQSNLTVFPVRNDKHVVSEEILLSHVTPEALRSILSDICFYGDIVQKIKYFIFANTTKSLTYEAFADALLKYYQEIKEELIAIERKILKHEVAILITGLFDSIQPICHQLNVINELFLLSIDVNQGLPNHEKVSKLLATLYELMMYQWYKCKDDESMTGNTYNKLVTLWLKTLKPYIDIIDQWITQGVLNDPYKEFIVQREITCYDSFDNEFWTNALSVKLESSNKNFPWLFPILNDVSLAGKSMEVLESTGTLFKRIDLKSITNPEKSLYKQFLNKINRDFLHPAETVDVQSTVPAPIPDVRSQSTLYEINFQRLLKDESPPFEETKFYKLDTKNPMPIVMARSLFPIVEEKCSYANKLLLHVILEEMHLDMHLHVLQQYHLMGWGDAMYDFCTSIFDKISHGEYWRELYSLNSALVDAVLSSNPSANSDEVLVGLNQGNMKVSGMEFMNATDMIELKYKVEWPINLIITADSLKIYNKVFCYLMKVKRALYSLEHLHFKSLLFECDQNPEVSDDPLENVFTAKEKAHRLCLLRAKVLRLVTCWHDFIMTSVIMQEKQTFKTTLKKADSLDIVRGAHEYFLTRLLSLCLLETNNKASKFVQGILHKILHLSIIIHSQWRRGVFDMSTLTLKKYEAQFEECSRNLSEILKSIVTRGAVPLLESLAYFFVNP